MDLLRSEKKNSCRCGWRRRRRRVQSCFVDKRHWYCPFFATLEDGACIRDNKSTWTFLRKKLDNLRDSREKGFLISEEILTLLGASGGTFSFSCRSLRVVGVLPTWRIGDDLCRHGRNPKGSLSHCSCCWEEKSTPRLFTRVRPTPPFTMICNGVPTSRLQPFRFFHEKNRRRSVFKPQLLQAPSVARSNPAQQLRQTPIQLPDMILQNPLRDFLLDPELFFQPQIP